MSALDRFKAWVGELTGRGLRQWEIAALVKCSEATIGRILSGERCPPSGLIAARIERATRDWSEGPILAADWYPVDDDVSRTGTEG